MSEPRASTSLLSRWILFLALAGMLLAAHLWVQKARGFDQGCLGLNKPTQVVSDGCREVNDLEASHLFGVSNAAWGYGFYFGLALLAFAKLVVSPVTARRLHFLGEIAVAAAFLYSAYLVYVMVFQLGKVCVLCATSAVCVTALAFLHVLVRRRGGFESLTGERRHLELSVSVGAIFATMGLMVAVLLFINRLGTRPLNEGIEEQEMQRVVGEALPLYIDSDRLDEMRACGFDRWQPKADLTRVVSAGIPALGKPGGMKIVAFYDPNCGVCQMHFPEFLRLAEKYKDRASFVAVPRPLWEKSLLQIAALKLAEPTGKYYELWRKMFEVPDERGMKIEEITAVFRELGLPTDNLEQRLKAVLPAVLEERTRAHLAGVDSLPAIYIDGRRVAQYNCSENCISKLLEWQLEHGNEVRHAR